MNIGSKIPTDNLVFGYDTGYPLVSDNSDTYKFNKGEPVQNLWDDILNTQSLRTHTKHFWNGTKWIEDATYTHPGIEGPRGIYLGIVFKHVSGALSNTWSGNSYGYMLRDIACTNGATMTMSCWVYTSTDCDVTAIPAVIEQEASGESTVTGYPASYDLNNKGTWQVIAKKATSDGQVRFIPVYPRKNGVTDGSFTGFFMWALPQVTYGDHVVQPIQPGDTRSVSGSLIELTRTNDIELTNVSFDSNAQMTFDGTDDRIDTELYHLSGSDHSEEVVVYRNTTGVQHGILSDLQYGFYGLFIGTDNKARFRQMQQVPDGNGGWSYPNVQVTSTSTLGVGYHHIVSTFSSEDGFRLYINGTLEASNATDLPFSPSGNRGINHIGVYKTSNATTYSNPFNGEINIVRCYNKALTDKEVAQNFNAIRERFNI